MAATEIAWGTGTGKIYLSYVGEGDGTIQVSSDANEGPAREQVITVQAVGWAASQNVTVRQKAGVPAIQNFSYTGSVQSCTLPAGTYRLQCWGAQGSANPADATYGITAQAGGKGGYSEGILKLTSATTVYIFVGGQPTNADNHGGWNGGGGGADTSTDGVATDSNGLGVSKIGRGGGGTDIALVTSTMNWSSNRTNRTSASLLSRFIVAGGGSGGAMALKRKTESTTSWQTVGTMNMENGTLNGHSYSYTQFKSGSYYYSRFSFVAGEDVFQAGDKIRITTSDSFRVLQFCWVASGQTTVYMARDVASTPVTADYIVCPGSGYNLRLQLNASSYYTGTILIEKEVTTTSTTDTYASQAGYAGGGVNGGGYSNSYYGQQDAAGNNGGFGYGAGVSGTAYRYTSARGGGGWYGGGETQTNTADNLNYIERSGGGSGFVNISGNAQYRPTDYSGLELSQGLTIAGDQSFESTSGGSETGHEGNGYARISDLNTPEALLKVPLSFDILTSGTVVWKATYASVAKTIQYRKNYGDWISITATTSGVSISVVAGDLLQFRGDNATYGTSSSYYNYFTGTATFTAWGNIMSLISSTSFATLTALTATYTFMGMFYNNTNLTDIARLQFPATTLQANCYRTMFSGCANIVNAVKTLPATTLQEGCYRYMYFECTSMVRGSDIMATALTNNSCQYMHDGCSSLKYVKCMATSGINTNSSTTSWLRNVPSGGAFVKASGATWPTSASGIPSSWEVIEV